jgi:hypothetical protein
MLDRFAAGEVRRLETHPTCTLRLRRRVCRRRGGCHATLLPRPRPEAVGLSGSTERASARSVDNGCDFRLLSIGRRSGAALHRGLRARPPPEPTTAGCHFYFARLVPFLSCADMPPWPCSPRNLLFARDSGDANLLELCTTWPTVAIPGANDDDERDQRCVDDLARFPKLFCQPLRTSFNQEKLTIFQIALHKRLIYI